MTLKNLLIMGSLVQAQEREQTGKSLEIVTFSLYFYLIEGIKIHSIFDYAKI